MDIRVGSVLMAESIAMKEALTQAAMLNLTNFTMASNSQQLINLINTDTYRLETYGITQDIIEIAKSRNVSLVFVNISENEEADRLSKTALADLLPNTSLNPV